MVDRLRAAGRVASATVERALMTVPRHHYVEGGSPQDAYAETAIMVKHAPDGTAISSASQPAIVAAMLELCHLEPGHRVLEVGTGTGYNAALMASIVGTTGRVATVELEDDLAEAAQERLQNHGFGQVEVVVGDGALGHPEGAPYERIVVTTGAPEVASAWHDQLVEGGRLVVPVVDPSGIGNIRCLVKQDGQLNEIARMPCGFLPMRGR
jgi:protein-L-isoaspartate(D-aspartate) O-methyltransferase